MKSKTREYRRPVPSGYLFSRPGYVKFLIREVASFILAGYAVFLLFVLMRARDEAAWPAFYQALKSPLSIVLHVVVLAAALYHSISFIDITPSVLVVHRGEDKVSDGAIKGVHYAAWAVATLVLLVIALVAR